MRRILRLKIVRRKRVAALKRITMKQKVSMSKNLDKTGFVRPVDFSVGSDVVIRVEDLWKQYRLGTINHGTLIQDLQSWWARLRGMEDPNVKVDHLARMTKDANLSDRETASSDFWALKEVSFDVRRGDTLGIIGKNGAGKSTLLKILSRVTTPTRGEINIRGRVASLLEVGTGFHPELTGRENVFLNGAILGMNKREIRGRLDEIIAFSEVEKFIDTPVKRYSSGMYVRLAFAVAAHLDPEILVVDEVLAVGDAEFQKKCLGKMGDVANEGRTVLFVSHNMQAVKRLCQKGVLLSQGRVALKGDAAEIVDSYLASGLKNEINTEISPQMHRLYTGDFQVLRVEIINQKGELADSLTHGEVFRLNFSFRIHNAHQSYRIGAIFRSIDETRIATIVNTHGGMSNISGEEGCDYQLAVEIKNVFLPGKYQFDVVVKSANNTAVSAVDGINFSVLDVSADSGSVQAYGSGFITIDARWGAPEQLMT